MDPLPPKNLPTSNPAYHYDNHSNNNKPTANIDLRSKISIVLDPMDHRATKDPLDDKSKSALIVFPSVETSYKELKLWNIETRQFLKQFQTKQSLEKANQNNRSWLSKLIHLFVCSSSRDKSVYPIPAIENSAVSVQKENLLVIQTVKDVNNDKKNHFNLLNLRSYCNSRISCMKRDKHIFRKKFQLLANEHTKTINTIKAMKQIIEKKLKISPELRVAKLMRLDAVAAEQESLRLESIREQHILELAQLEEKQRCEELKFANEIEQENQNVVKESKFIQDFQMLKFRLQYTTNTSVSVEKELESEQDYLAHLNKLKNEILKSIQDKRIEVQLNRLQKKQDHQDLQRKELEEMLQNQKKQIDLHAIIESEHESKFSEKSETALVEHSSFFHYDNNTEDSELTVGRHCRTGSSDSVNKSENYSKTLPDLLASFKDATEMGNSDSPVPVGPRPPVYYSSTDKASINYHRRAGSGPQVRINCKHRLCGGKTPDSTPTLIKNDLASNRAHQDLLTIPNNNEINNEKAASADERNPIETISHTTLSSLELGTNSPTSNESNSSLFYTPSIQEPTTSLSFKHQEGRRFQIQRRSFDDSLRSLPKGQSLQEQKDC